MRTNAEAEQAYEIIHRHFADNWADIVCGRDVKTVREELAEAGYTMLEGPPATEGRIDISMWTPSHNILVMQIGMDPFYVKEL